MLVVGVIRDLIASAVCFSLAMGSLAFLEGYIALQIAVAVLGLLLLVYTLLSFAALDRILHDDDHDAHVEGGFDDVAGSLDHQDHDHSPGEEALKVFLQEEEEEGEGEQGEQGEDRADHQMSSFVHKMERIGGRTFPPSSINEACTICLGGFEENPGGGGKESSRRMFRGCSHCFHSRCIRMWLSLNASCPLCRNRPRQGICS